MIEFKIIATVDKSQQSTYQHTGLELTMGKTDGDMLIDDPQMADKQIRIYWAGSNYMIENLDHGVEVRLNGKALKEAMPLKERDNLNMGRTTVNFVKLNRSGLTPPGAHEHPQASTRFVAGNKEMAILEALEYLEKSEGGGAGAPKAPPPLPGGKMPPLPPKKP
jgi:hypothetical protein